LPGSADTTLPPYARNQHAWLNRSLQSKGGDFIASPVGANGVPIGNSAFGRHFDLGPDLKTAESATSIGVAHRNYCQGLRPPTTAV